MPGRQRGGGASCAPLAPSVLRQKLHEAGGVPAVAAAGLHLAVELVDQGGDRQARAVLLGLGQADAEVLAHPVDGEAEVEPAFATAGAAVVHLPGLRRPTGTESGRESGLQSVLVPW